MNSLQKHLRDVIRRLAAYAYDLTSDGGIRLSSQAYLRGNYSLKVDDGRVIVAPNLWPVLGLNYMLNQLMGGGSAAPLYMSLYAGAVSPDSTWTAASYPGAASEITSGSEGYTQSNRVQWVPAAAALGAKNNFASVGVFTIITASTLVVNGIAMHTAAGKGAITGVLVSASRFGAAQSFTNGNTFNGEYELDLTTA